MPEMAAPMTIALPAFVRNAERIVSERSWNAIQRAAREAAIAITMDRVKRSGS
jgi:hypothetical protein